MRWTDETLNQTHTYSMHYQIQSDDNKVIKFLLLIKKLYLSIFLFIFKKKIKIIIKMHLILNINVNNGFLVNIESYNDNN